MKNIKNIKNIKDIKNIKVIKKPSKKLVKRLVLTGFVFSILIASGAVALETVEAKQEQKANKAMITIVSKQAKEAGITLITEEEAKQVALQEVALKEDQVKHLEVKLEMDEDDVLPTQYVYEVEFVHNGLEYEITIDGAEKTVVHTEVDSWND